MKLQKFMPLVKMQEQPDGTLMVFGLVTAEQPDLDKEVCDYFKTKPYYQAQVEKMKKATDVPGMEQSIMPMREMHQLKAIGKGVSIDFDDENKCIKMGFNVVDPEAITKFRKGVLIGFSQGGDFVGPKVPDPVFKGCKRYTADPSEVSAVDSPCLPIALVESMKAQTFEYAKVDGSTEMRKFYIAPTAVEDRNGLVKVNDREMVETTEAESTFSLSVDGVLKHYKVKPPSDLELLKTQVEELTKAVKEIPKVSTTGEVEKKEFSDDQRQELAESGAAMPDGSFPIENEADLHNAVQAYGRAKDKEAAKEHIKRRAKHLGAEGKLPDTWKSTTTSLFKAWKYQNALSKADFEGLQELMSEDVLTTLQKYENIPELLEMFGDEEVLAAVAAEKGQKNMNKEEMLKAAAAHLTKAKEMVKSHVAHLGAVCKAHMDNCNNLGAAHCAAMEGMPSVAAAKSLSKTHQEHMAGVHKSHVEHMAALGKAFHEGMNQHLAKADSPAVTEIVDIPNDDDDPEAIDPITGAPKRKVPSEIGAEKGITKEDMQKAISDALEAQEEKFTKMMVEALTPEEDEPVSKGIGKRETAQPVKVQKTHPVTKNDDGDVDPPKNDTITPEDVRKSMNGNPESMLKLARSIRPETGGVPQHVQAIVGRR